MRTMQDEYKNPLHGLFKPINVPADIPRPASAIQADLDDAKKSSRYEKQLLERLNHNYAVPRDRLGGKKVKGKRPGAQGNQ